jgi:hypothetical protein
MVDFPGGADAPTANGSMDQFRAVAFSPNFPSDYMALAVSEDVYVNANDTVGALRLHILSFNSWRWDDNVSAGYPVAVAAGAAATAFAVNSASIAMLPEYDGADEALRVAFVGASITSPAVEAGGIWRCRDSAAAARILGTAATGVGINSVAFDGTNLAGGSWDTNSVWRSADPLSTNPTFLPARTLKRIGTDQAAFNDRVLVTYLGDTLYGTKQGAASAVSKSMDYGNTWNDFTYMDSGVGLTPGNITDIYMTATGDPWYLAANDGAESSIYRMSAMSVTKVLCVPVATAAALALRGIDSDPNVVYAFDVAGTAIFYTADGGLSRWYQRVAPAAVADLAVESSSVIYVGDNAANTMRQSVNSGFTWGPPRNTLLGAGNNINVLVSIAENQVVVGGTASDVTYTLDGGTSFVETLGILPPGGAVQVAASGLGAGDFIFAAQENAVTVWRCEIGPTNPPGEFRTMNSAAATAAETTTGMRLIDGVLYNLCDDAPNEYLDSTLMPTFPGTHIAPFWRTQPATEGRTFGLLPNALEASSAGGVITLYAADTVANTVWYFQDTVALTAPSLVGPADGTQVAVNSINGAVQAVNFTWSRLSLSTNYFLWLALDPLFAEQLGISPVAVASGAPTVSNIVAGGNFQPGQTIYWRVTTTNPMTSPPSETRSIVVQPTGAAVPEIGAPEPGGTIDSTTPAFSWTPASDATMYRFQLSEGTAFLAPLIDENLSSTGIRPSMELEPGKTYFWRVKAIAPVEGPWSMVSSFTVALPAEEPPPPVVVETVPAPVITVETPPPPAPIEILPTPPADEIAPAYIWAIIIIGAILVIAVIILIVRTRRSV